MKIAILSNQREDSVINVITKSFESICINNGCLPTIFKEGLNILEDSYVQDRSKKRIKNIFKRILNFTINSNFKIENVKDIFALGNYLKDFECIVVVSVVPQAFIKERLSGISLLRRITKKPIVLLANYFPGNRSLWPIWLNKFYDSTDFDRFDYYIATTDSSFFPLPKKINNPYSKVGFFIKSTDLFFDEKGSFIALLDFPRQGFEKERDLQKAVLNKLEIPFIELSGHFSLNEIRKIYRSVSCFFLSFGESFGVPILELQAAGAGIFLPNKEWASGHLIKKNSKKELGSNFFVYHNDPVLLENMLVKFKESYKPENVFQNFTKEYPEFYSGNTLGFSDFKKKLAKGEISYLSHKNYEGLMSTYADFIEKFCRENKSELIRFINDIDKDKIEKGHKIT